VGMLQYSQEGSRKDSRAASRGEALTQKIVWLARRGRDGPQEYYGCLISALVERALCVMKQISLQPQTSTTHSINFCQQYLCRSCLGQVRVYNHCTCSIALLQSNFRRHGYVITAPRVVAICSVRGLCPYLQCTSFPRYIAMEY
jgi:hypothetical protein